MIARAECLFCALPLCSFKAARAFLSCRFGVPEQSVAKAIAALTIYKYKCEPVDIVIAAIDLAPDLGRSRRNQISMFIRNNTRHARRRARVL